MRTPRDWHWEDWYFLGLSVLLALTLVGIFVFEWYEHMGRCS